jgi:phosphoribosyl 1,2-cyclic phosphodiesterase
VKVTLWGTRGSLPCPGPETIRYGGNTPCVELRAADGGLVILDAGTGIRRLGPTIPRGLGRVDILLTHLHLDHIQGLGFFEPLQWEGQEVHIWGPASPTQNLRTRLAQYLSPPLFPVRIRDLPSRLILHDVPLGPFEIGPFQFRASLVCHPGPTVGFRATDGSVSIGYLPDHEPILGSRGFQSDGEWVSGFELARDADLLIHDTQYTRAEYEVRAGWGHSAIQDAIEYAATARVKRMVAFHHDPEHGDAMLDAMLAQAQASAPPFELLPGQEGATFEIL